MQMQVSSSNLLRLSKTIFIILRLVVKVCPDAKFFAKWFSIVHTFVLKVSGHPQVRFTFKL